MICQVDRDLIDVLIPMYICDTLTNFTPKKADVCQCFHNKAVIIRNNNLIKDRNENKKLIIVDFD